MQDWQRELIAQISQDHLQPAAAGAGSPGG